MNPQNRVLSVVAFYLSEYDMETVKELGFRTRSEAIQIISERIGNGNYYLKLRRDEFDALPDSSSPRKGWRNRPPLKEVSDMAEYLHRFSFSELSEIVKSLINNTEVIAFDDASDSEICNSEQMNEEEIECIVNFTDPSAQLVYKTNEGNKKIYN